MRMNKFLLASILLLIPRALFGTTVTLTGVVMNPASSVPLQGQACFQLPVNAIDTSTSRALTTLATCFRIVNGTFPLFATVVPNDVIQPLNTYYTATYYDRTGQFVGMANYVIPTGGGTFNVGLAIPTAVTTSNISFISPACLSCNNTFTGLNTFTQQLAETVSTGTAPFSITSTTLVPNLNVQVLNGVTVTGTPSNGALLQATSSSAASWASPSGLQSFYTNSASPGTAINLIAKLAGAPSVVQTAAITDTGGAVGICLINCTTSGLAGITTTGQASCVFDGVTTAGDYVQISATVAGDCHDAGNAYPSSGQVLGRVLSTNGAGGTYNMTLFGTEIKGSTPAVTVNPFSSTTLVGDVSVSATTQTDVMNRSITMPASGCPCRVLLSYSLYVTTASSGVGYSAWVNDGTVNMAGTNAGQSNGTSGGLASLSYGGYTTVTYANGANVTFTLRTEGDHTYTVRAASQVAGSAPNSSFQVSAVSSN